MLCLTRKPGQQIVLSFPGLPAPIVVSANWIDGQKVSLGIEAPAEVSILRAELYPPQQPEPAGA